MHVCNDKDLGLCLLHAGFVRFHPDFHDRNSQIQREMMEYMHKWVQGLGSKQRDILDRLSKDAVRNHRNVRLAGEGGPSAAQGSFAVNAAHQAQQNLHSYANQIPVVGSAVQFASGMQDMSGHNQPPGYSHHGHGHSSGPVQTPSSFMGNIPGMGKIGEAQAFLGQFGSGPGRREINEPSYPGGSPGYMPGMPSQPTSHMPPTSPPSHPSFPGGPSAPSPYGGSNYPGSPGAHTGYAPSYAPPEPATGYPGYGSSYASPSGPPPSFPSGPGYPVGGPGGMPNAQPGGGVNMPHASPSGTPGFPGADPYGGFGYNDPPSDRPFGY
jgi:hypothetical protein